LKDPLIEALASGPATKVRTWKRYSINGYKFRAFKEGVNLPKCTINNGVHLNSTDGLEYYGSFVEAVELQYTSDVGIHRTVLFKCDWFDNSSKGFKVDRTYNLVDVNPKQKYPKYEPFVLAYLVEQVCYAPYPGAKKNDEWLAVFKIKVRPTVDAPNQEETIFQENVTIGSRVSPIEFDDVEEENNDEDNIEAEANADNNEDEESAEDSDDSEDAEDEDEGEDDNNSEDGELFSENSDDEQLLFFY